MNIELIQIPKYSSENFILIYSAVNPKMRNIYHSDGKPARVTNCNNEQLKEIHKLMTDARRHRKHKLAPVSAHDVEENI